ncbi:MAG: hypothetical protein ACFFAN_07140 [Promethearchaeota archaeon]
MPINEKEDFTILSAYNSYFTGRSHGIEGIELECKGMGTQDNPIIITSSENLPKVLTISKSNQHIVIRNLNLRFIGLYSCKNITIEKCKFEAFKLFHCSDFKIKNSSFGKFSLKECHDIEVEGCSMNRIRIVRLLSNQINKFKNCTLDRLKEKFRNKLIFEKTNIKIIDSDFSIKNFIWNNKKEILLNSLGLIIVSILLVFVHFFL